MKNMKPSEVANLCATKILPMIAFLVFSTFSFLHVFSDKCSVEHDCLFRIVVGAWYIAIILGVAVGVVILLIVSGQWISDKWNEWLDRMDKESGY